MCWLKQLLSHLLWHSYRWKVPLTPQVTELSTNQRCTRARQQRPKKETNMWLKLLNPPSHSQEGERRFQEATARKKIRLDRCVVTKEHLMSQRLDQVLWVRAYGLFLLIQGKIISVWCWESPLCFRKYIISHKQGEVPLSVPWDPTNQVWLIRWRCHMTAHFGPRGPQFFEAALTL